MLAVRSTKHKVRRRKGGTHVSDHAATEKNEELSRLRAENEQLRAAVTTLKLLFVRNSANGALD
jgi:hypothetical protein